MARSAKPRIEPWPTDPTEAHERAVAIGVPAVSFNQWCRLYPDADHPDDVDWGDPGMEYCLDRDAVVARYVAQLRRDTYCWVAYKGTSLRQRLRLVRRPNAQV